MSDQQSNSRIMTTRKKMFLFTRKGWVCLMYSIPMLIIIALTTSIFSKKPNLDEKILGNVGTDTMKKQQMNLNLKQDDFFFFKTQRRINKIKSLEREKMPRVYTFSEGSWRIAEVCQPYQTYIDSPDFYLTSLFSEAGAVNMFVHNPKFDTISGTIKNRHSFEPENVDFIILMLRKDPLLSLIDIGANVGIHTMAAALLGRQVLAIDAVKENIQHICASVEYQNFTNRVSLIHNAVSDKHGKIDMILGGGGDYGLTHVVAGDAVSGIESKHKSYFKDSKIITVDSLTLDDIVNLPRLTFFKHIFIKMDVEGHEHKVLLGAKKFMKAKLPEVKGIFMEWEWISKEQVATKTIIELMKEWNFEPYNFQIRVTLLDTRFASRWPRNVLWLPKGSRKLEI